MSDATLPPYLVALMAAYARGLIRPGECPDVTVLHDDDCPLLLGVGPSDCEPLLEPRCSRPAGEGGVETSGPHRPQRRSPSTHTRDAARICPENTRNRRTRGPVPRRLPTARRATHATDGALARTPFPLLGRDRPSWGILAPLQARFRWLLELGAGRFRGSSRGEDEPMPRTCERCGRPFRVIALRWAEETKGRRLTGARYWRAEKPSRLEHVPLRVSAIRPGSES